MVDFGILSDDMHPRTLTIFRVFSPIESLYPVKIKYGHGNTRVDVYHWVFVILPVVYDIVSTVTICNQNVNSEALLATVTLNDSIFFLLFLLSVINGLNEKC